MVELSAALAVGAVVSTGAIALGSHAFRANAISGEVDLVHGIVSSVHSIFAGSPDYAGISSYDIRTVPGFSAHIATLPGIGPAIVTPAGQRIAVTSTPGQHVFYISIPAASPAECLALAEIDDPIWLASSSLASGGGAVTYSGPASAALVAPICAAASNGSPATIRLTYR